jgi:hypothetical protein
MASGQGTLHQVPAELGSFDSAASLELRPGHDGTGAIEACPASRRSAEDAEETGQGAGKGASGGSALSGSRSARPLERGEGAAARLARIS